MIKNSKQLQLQLNNKIIPVIGGKKESVNRIQKDYIIQLNKMLIYSKKDNTKTKQSILVSDDKIKNNSLFKGESKKQNIKRLKKIKGVF